MSLRVVISLLALQFAVSAAAQSNPFASSPPPFKAEAIPPPVNASSPANASLPAQRTTQPLPPLPPLPPPPLVNLPVLHVLSIHGEGDKKVAVIGIAANPAMQQAGGTQIASTLIARNGQSLRIDKGSYVAEVIGDSVRLHDLSGDVAWQGRIEFPIVQTQGANPSMAAGAPGAASMTVGTPMPSPSAKIVGAASGGQGMQTSGAAGGQNQFGTTR